MDGPIQIFALDVASSKPEGPRLPKGSMDLVGRYLGLKGPPISLL